MAQDTLAEIMRRRAAASADSLRTQGTAQDKARQAVWAKATGALPPGSPVFDEARKGIVAAPWWSDTAGQAVQAGDAAANAVKTAPGPATNAPTLATAIQPAGGASNLTSPVLQLPGGGYAFGSKPLPAAQPAPSAPAPASVPPVAAAPSLAAMAPTPLQNTIASLHNEIAPQHLPFYGTTPTLSSESARNADLGTMQAEMEMAQLQQGKPAARAAIGSPAVTQAAAPLSLADQYKAMQERGRETLARQRQGQGMTKEAKARQARQDESKQYVKDVLARREKRVNDERDFEQQQQERGFRQNQTLEGMRTKGAQDVAGIRAEAGAENAKLREEHSSAMEKISQERNDWQAKAAAATDERERLKAQNQLEAKERELQQKQADFDQRQKESEASGASTRQLHDVDSRAKAWPMIAAEQPAIDAAQKEYDAAKADMDSGISHIKTWWGNSAENQRTAKANRLSVATRKLAEAKSRIAGLPGAPTLANQSTDGTKEGAVPVTDGIGPVAGGGATEDQEALQWAKQNPHDPRAKRILSVQRK